MKKFVFAIMALVLLVGCTKDIGSETDLVQNELVSETETDGNVTTDNDEGDVQNNDQDNDYTVCTEIPLFEYAPVNIEKTKIFIPLGLMTGSHVTPIDHHYFQNFDNVGYNIEVYSPGDGNITSIQHMPGYPDGEDYRVVIEHGCGVSSIYIHLGTLAEKFAHIAPELNGSDYGNANEKILAGELLGYYERNVDYNIVDLNFTLTGFVRPESYSGESWKIHVPNTYDYFTDAVNEQLIGISQRTVEPIVGKIDYDIEGKLVGNWFLEGTNGYSGGEDGYEGYWMGHLAIAYDHLDPDGIVFSIGGYLGEDSRQLTVKGNYPDPKDVGIESGVIKYELMRYDYYTLDGNRWDRNSEVEQVKIGDMGFVDSILLVQVLENNEIRFELFFDTDVEDVTDFTSEAIIYTR